jgi:hypothetical protein
MTVLRCENLSDVRLQETEDETDQDIEQVIPATIAISSHFRAFSVFDMGWHLLTILMNDPGFPQGHYALSGSCRSP